MYIPTGSVVSTTAGNLKAEHLILAVGPDIRAPCQRGLNQNKLLEYATQSSLHKANELACESISIPALSCGNFGFPKGVCARILLRSIGEFQQ